MKVHLYKDGKQYGPYTVEQLRQYVQRGNFTSADHACFDGRNWVTVGEVPGFAAGGDSMTTPQQPQAVQQQAMSTVSGSKRKKIVLWSSIGGSATLLVIGLLVWILGGDEGVPESSQMSAEPVDAKTAEVPKIDLDDPAIRNRIIAEATRELQVRGKPDGSYLHYLPRKQTPYTGWHVVFHDNGQAKSLARFKDGKLVTIVVWKPNGEKCPHTNVVNGNGVMVYYNDDGTEAFRQTF